MTSLHLLAALTALAILATIRTLYVDAREARNRNERLAARMHRAEERARRAEDHADEAQREIDMLVDLSIEQAKGRHPSARHLSVVSS